MVVISSMSVMCSLFLLCSLLLASQRPAREMTNMQQYGYLSIQRILSFFVKCMKVKTNPAQKLDDIPTEHLGYTISCSYIGMYIYAIKFTFLRGYESCGHQLYMFKYVIQNHNGLALIVIQYHAYTSNLNTTQSSHMS